MKEKHTGQLSQHLSLTKNQKNCTKKRLLIKSILWNIVSLSTVSISVTRRLECCSRIASFFFSFFFLFFFLGGGVGGWCGWGWGGEVGFFWWRWIQPSSIIEYGCSVQVGGLDIHKLGTFNQTLFWKRKWRYEEVHDNLWRQVIKGTLEFLLRLICFKLGDDSGFQL